MSCPNPNAAALEVKPLGRSKLAPASKVGFGLWTCRASGRRVGRGSLRVMLGLGACTVEALESRCCGAVVTQLLSGRLPPPPQSPTGRRVHGNDARFCLLTQTESCLPEEGALSVPSSDWLVFRHPISLLSESMQGFVEVPFAQQPKICLFQQPRKR